MRALVLPSGLILPLGEQYQSLTDRQLGWLLRGVRGAGVPKSRQQTLIEGTTLTNQNLYLRAFTRSDSTLGDPLTELGKMNTNVAEIPAGSGYAVLGPFATGAWGTTVLGSAGVPCYRPFPGTGSQSWTASGTTWPKVVGWAFTTISTATFSNTGSTYSDSVVLSGPFTDTGGSAVIQDIADGGTLEIASTLPIKMRFGIPTDF